MPRQTKIKKGSIDLNSVFSAGYQLDIDGRLITGYKWEKFEPALNPNDNSITTFQLPENAHVVDSVLLLYMFVNGVKVEPDYLSLDAQEQTILTYDDSDYPITFEDVIDIWYVPAQYAAVPENPDAPELPGAAGLAGHIQINDGQDQITFAPLKWINNALIPDDDLIYDLGSPTRRWNDLYINSNSIHLGAATLSYNPVSGSLTLNGDDLATADQVSPQTLLQDQNFVTQITGPQGPQGSPGPQGPVGPQGDTGLSGADGVAGPQGPAGPQGIQGPQGVAGATGPAGPQGAAGPEGPTGPQGDVGPQGVAGPTGPAGSQGSQGIQGDIGPQGLVGPAGPQGPQGSAGTGITFKGQVSSDPTGTGGVTPLLPESPFTPSQGDAVLSQVDDSLFIFTGSAWVDGGSIQGPQGLQGIEGPQGPVGPQGAAGPQGIQGPQGPAGATGSTGPQGDTGATGSQGPQGPAGPAGPQGPQGVAGTQGQAGPAGADGTQGPAGSAGASVTSLSALNNTITTQLSNGSTITGSLSMNLTSLSDVDLYATSSTITDGYVLTYEDSNGGYWRPEPVSSTAANIALNDLSDLSTANAIAENNLVYDGTNWVNSFTKETVEANVQDINFSAGSWSTLNITNELNNNQITWDYAIRVNITVLANLGSITITLPTPSQVNLGKTIEFIFPPQHPNPSYPFPPYAHTKTASSNALSQDFVDDGNFTTTNPAYYRFENSRAITFRLVSINGSLKYKAIRNRPYDETDNNKLFKNNTEIFISDTGSDGNINLTTDGASRWDVTSAGHIIPATNANYDIGNASNKVRHLFLSDNSIKFESGDVGVDNDGDITFAKTGESAVKLATQTYELLKTADMNWPSQNDLGVGVAVAIDGNSAYPLGYSSTYYNSNDRFTLYGITTGQGPATQAKVMTKGKLQTQWTASGVNVGDAVYCNTKTWGLQAFTTNYNEAISTRGLVHRLGYVDTVNTSTGHTVIIDIHNEVYPVTNLVNEVRVATTSQFLVSGGSYAHTADLVRIIHNSGSSNLTIDGVNVSLGDKILIKDGGSQSFGSTSNADWNGFWYVDSVSGSQFILKRLLDNELDSRRQNLRVGNFAYIKEGTVNAGRGFVCTNATISGSGGSISFQEILSQEANLLTVRGGAASGALKLNCEQNSHGVTIQGPAHSAGATYTLTLPDDTGSADQVLKTNGSGALSWTDQAGGAGYQIEETTGYFQTGHSWDTNKSAIWLLTTTNNSVGGDLVRPPTNGVAGDTFNYIVTGLSSYKFKINTGVTVWEGGSVLTGYSSITRSDRYVLNRYLCIGNNTWVKMN